MATRVCSLAEPFSLTLSPGCIVPIYLTTFKGNGGGGVIVIGPEDGIPEGKLAAAGPKGGNPPEGGAEPEPGKRGSLGGALGALGGAIGTAPLL